MAETFHFVSLECLKQNEPLHDEIVVMFQGHQVFPKAGEAFQFKRGTVVASERVPDGHAHPNGALMVPPYPGVEEFLEAPIPSHGLGVRLVEKDWPFSADDIIGQILISPIATRGVTSKVLRGAGAEYRLSWMVV